MVWNYDPIAIANLQIQPSDLTPRLREDLYVLLVSNVYITLTLLF